MSIEAMSWALNVPIGGNAKVVLIGLANHARKDGTDAYPALNTLAEYACCDRSTVRRNLVKLVEAGWIEENGVSHLGTANYDLSMGVAKCHGGKMPRSKSTPSGVANRAEGGGTSVPPEPSFNRPEPSPVLVPRVVHAHAGIVYELLCEYATSHRCPTPSKDKLARVIRCRTKKPLVQAAHDFLAYLEGQTPAKQKRRDLVGGYQWQLDNRWQDLGETEELDSDGSPVTAPLRLVTPPMMSAAQINDAKLQESRAAAKAAWERIQQGSATA